jgi:hypothetical protein
MIYDLAVWEGPRPSEADARDVFEALYNKNFSDDHRPNPPTPAIQAYVDALLDRWYDITDPREDGNSPGPTDHSSATPRARSSTSPCVPAWPAKPAPSAPALAAERRLNCYDPQFDCLRPTADES